MPTGNVLARDVGQPLPPPADGASSRCIRRSITNVGGSQPHNNMMPYLVLNFCIALQGIFPSQN